MYTQGHSRLISTGVYIPEQHVTSREMMQHIESAGRFDIPYDWLEKVTGIKERRLTTTDILPSDMAVAAASQALERSQLSARDIDVIIYAGVIRDYLVEPATAHAVQAKLSAGNAVVFDVSNACHGFMNGIHLMDALIATGQARRGLVVTGEQNRLYIEKTFEALKEVRDKHDFVKLAAGLTLGDAGAAVVMGPKTDPDSGFVGFMLQSQGQHAGLCTCGGPLKEGPLMTDMPGIVGESTKLIAAMFRDFMFHRLKWRIADLGKYVIHQVGGKTFKLHEQILDVPIDIMPNTVSMFGNITTATIPVNIHYCATENRVRPGEKVYLSGAGSGVSISQAGLIWDAA